MKVSKGQSQPEIVADVRLLNSLHGSGFTIFVPGFDCDSNGFPELELERPILLSHWASRNKPSSLGMAWAIFHQPCPEHQMPVQSNSRLRF